jgi:hypothetical protein
MQNQIQEKLKTIITSQTHFVFESVVRTVAELVVQTVVQSVVE